MHRADTTKPGFRIRHRLWIMALAMVLFLPPLSFLFQFTGDSNFCGTWCPRMFFVWRQGTSLDAYFMGYLRSYMGVALVFGIEEGPRFFVGQVRVEGNRAVSVRKILANLHTRPGRRFDMEIVEEDVRRLNKTRLFTDVEPFIQQVPGGFQVQANILEVLIFQEFLVGPDHGIPGIHNQLGLVTVKKVFPLQPVLKFIGFEWG